MAKKLKVGRAILMDRKNKTDPNMQTGRVYVDIPSATTGSLGFAWTARRGRVYLTPVEVTAGKIPSSATTARAVGKAVKEIRESTAFANSGDSVALLSPTEDRLDRYNPIAKKYLKKTTDFQRERAVRVQNALTEGLHNKGIGECTSSRSPNPGSKRWNPQKPCDWFVGESRLPELELLSGPESDRKAAAQRRKKQELNDKVERVARRIQQQAERDKKRFERQANAPRRRREAIETAESSKGKRCKILAKRYGYRIKQCGRNYFEAIDAYDEKKGSIQLSNDGDGIYSVALSTTTEDTRGQKVGTALYEAAAEALCKRGDTLASGSTRSRFSEYWWNKQENKGRATCADGEGLTFEEAWESVVDDPARVEEAYENYVSNNNLTYELSEAYYEQNPDEESEAREYYIEKMVDTSDLHEAYFNQEDDARIEAISEYMDENNIRGRDEDETASYYSAPWETTQYTFQKRMEEAETEDERENIQQELDRLDELLPEAEWAGWPCYQYRLDTGTVCKGKEIDLGKLPKTKRCPPGYRKHRAKNGQVTCRKVRKRQRGK